MLLICIMLFQSPPIDTRISWVLSVDMLIPWSFPVDTGNGAPKVVEMYVVRHVHSRKMCVRYRSPQKMLGCAFQQELPCEYLLTSQGFGAVSLSKACQTTLHEHMIHDQSERASAKVIVFLL